MMANKVSITTVSCLLLFCYGVATLDFVVAAEVPQTRDWIRTLMPAQRGGEEGCPEDAGPEAGGEPILTVLFTAGTASLTEVGRSGLEPLAVALASDCLKNSDFELQWYPGSAVASDLPLAEQRAATVRDYLILVTQLPPTSIMMEPSTRRPSAGGSRDSIVVAKVKRYDRS